LDLAFPAPLPANAKLGARGLAEKTRPSRTPINFALGEGGTQNVIHMFFLKCVLIDSVNSSPDPLISKRKVRACIEQSI